MQTSLFPPSPPFFLLALSFYSFRCICYCDIRAYQAKKILPFGPSPLNGCKFRSLPNVIYFFFSYLLQDLPQLIEGRIDYFEPSFEAMIRSGVSFVFLRTWQVLSQSWLLYIPQEVNTQGRPKRIYVVHGKTTALVWTHSLETWLVPRRALLKSTPRVSQQKNCKARGDDESMRGKRGKSMQARDISY